ncbi:MAG: DUF2165 domain-containing protein [Methylocystis sp.]|nr:DUF2165 domain-containing protein [Methylocystis sp.]
MIRIAKIALTLLASIVLFLVGLDNLLDYDTNLEVVKHILSMDAVPSGPLSWRAIHDPAAQQYCYWLIIATEFLAALLTFYGALKLGSAYNLSDSTFNRNKAFAIGGLTLAFSLYFFGFLGIGGEWFEMWRAGQWNMQEPAFRFVGAIGLVMLFVNQRDG